MQNFILSTRRIEIEQRTFWIDNFLPYQTGFLDHHIE